MAINNSSEVYYNKGISHYEREEYELAIENFRKAVEHDPSNFRFFYNLGLAYVKTEETDLAIDSFKKSIKLNPQDADSYQNLGLAYHKNEEFDKAINAYSNAIEISPKDSIGYDNLGITLFTVKDFDKAILNFKKSLELNPDNPSTAYNLAYTYYSNKQFDLAEESFILASSLNPNDDEAFFNLGNVYLIQEKYDRAEENLKKALSLNPDHAEARSALSELNEFISSMGNNKAVQEHSKIEKTHKEIILEKSKEEFKADLRHEATHCFNSALELLKEKKLELAAEELKKTLILNPRCSDAQEILNNTNNLLNETRTLMDKGLSYFVKNKYIHAINCLKKASDIKPHDTQISDLLTRVIEKKEIIDQYKMTYQTHIQNGQFDQAARIIKKSIEESPLDPDVYYDLGNIYIRLGKFDLAIGSLKKALSIEPEHKAAKETLSNLIKTIRP